MIVDYVHRPLDQEVTAIGGHYVVKEEVRLPFEDRQLLYLKGYAMMDTSCCGPGGCAFVQVKGFVVRWKGGKNPEGIPVSRIEPIHSEGMRDRIRRWLQRKEVFHQVQFD